MLTPCFVGHDEEQIV